MGIPKESYKTPEEKIEDAKRHLLLFLRGGSGRAKTFSKPDTAYTLYGISSFLQLNQSEVISLLDSIPGFERINRYGTDKATAYKLKHPEFARSHLEELLGQKSQPEQISEPREPIRT